MNRKKLEDLKAVKEIMIDIFEYLSYKIYQNHLLYLNVSNQYEMNIYLEVVEKLLNKYPQEQFYVCFDRIHAIPNLNKKRIVDVIGQNCTLEYFVNLKVIHESELCALKGNNILRQFILKPSQTKSFPLTRAFTKNSFLFSTYLKEAKLYSKVICRFKFIDLGEYKKLVRYTALLEQFLKTTHFNNQQNTQPDVLLNTLKY